MARSARDFLNRAGNRFKRSYINLREAKRVVGWLHPDSGYEERSRHIVPDLIEDEESGKTEIKPTSFTCPGEKTCPLDIVIDFFRNEDNAPDVRLGDVVLEIGRGSKATEITRKDMVGDGHWKNNPEARREWVFGIVDRDDPAEVRIMPVPDSCGQKLKSLIEDMVEELGEEKGDPFRTPYAIKFSYDEKLHPKDKYNARYTPTDITPEVQERLDSAGVDVVKLCEPTSEDEILEWIRQWWALPKGLLEEMIGGKIQDDGSRRGDDDEDPRDRKEREDRGGERDEDDRKTHDDGDDRSRGRGERDRDSEDELSRRRESVREKEGEKIRCVECRAPISPDAKFCVACGARQATEEKQEPPKEERQSLECPSCHEEIEVSRTTRFCPECGKDIDLDTLPF